MTEDGASWGIVLHAPTADTYAAMVVRRRVDLVWIVTYKKSGFSSFSDAREQVRLRLNEGEPREPMPKGVSPRPSLVAGASHSSSKLFQLLATPSRNKAAWVLGHLYLSLPKPDKNFTQQFQGENLHARMWELLLLASFREQGCFVSQDHPSPDFHIQRRSGIGAWIEAVTANPPDDERYEHVGAPLASIPSDPMERCLGAAAVRFAKTIKSKTDRHYDKLDHVNDQPFAIAIADFHAQGSMRWSRGALMTYLYGHYATEQIVDGVPTAVGVRVENLLSEQSIPAGLFCSSQSEGLSAVIFNNACSIAKFSRVMASMTREDGGFSRTRCGEMFDRDPGVLKGVQFCLNVNSQEYRDLWPQQYEPWSAEMEVFHNPFAKHPMSKQVLPEAQHWLEKNGDIVCEAFYETSILWSETLVRESGADPIRIEDVFQDDL
ncbi:hypothetical protein [Pseudomonas sp. NA-150]|uniref:hypothetical protein n=1 Tax=Pseudomonas sp. NA-150 TaxID=3367525 RepID=UPI0037C8ACC1